MKLTWNIFRLLKRPKFQACRLAHDWKWMEIWKKIIIKFAFIAIFRVSNFCAFEWCGAAIHRFSSFTGQTKNNSENFYTRRPFPSFNLLIILWTKIFTLFPFFFSNFFIHIFLRLCRTRPKSLICTNFCLRFSFYDRKMNIYNLSVVARCTEANVLSKKNKQMKTNENAWNSAAFRAEK